MIIGITGYRGRLGSQLVSMPNCVPLICDITDKNSIIEALERSQPDVVINCAANTNVDNAEIDFEKSLMVNSRGVARLRSEFTGKLIHISTDYVFNGKKGAYAENRVRKPFNAYGYTKLGGEIICENYYPERETCIVRTTGLYGGDSGKPDFASAVVSFLSNGKPFRATSELYGNQTYVPHLATAIYKLATEYYVFPKKVHIASKEVISRYHFARMIAMRFGFDDSLIVSCKNNDVPGWIAERPTKGGLVMDYAVEFGLPIYSISEGLDDYMEKVNDNI